MVTRYISAGNQAALEKSRLVARDFLRIVVRHRISGVPVEECMWSDIGDVTAEMIRADTGAATAYNFYGSGTLVAISEIPMVSNLTVQNVTISLSQVDDKVDEIFRTYDAQQASIEIWRALFDPDTRLIVAPGESRFAGFVDKIEVNTPAEGGEGSVELTCTSHSQELTRSNPATRSDASQKERDPEDEFFEDSSTAGEWEVFWGSVKGKVATEKPRKKFLGIF